jgi:hypothetical protein
MPEAMGRNKIVPLTKAGSSCGAHAHRGSDDSEEEARARKRGATRVNEIEEEEEEEDVGDEDFVKLAGGKGTSRKVVQNLEAPFGLWMVRCVPKKDKTHSVVNYKKISNDEYIEVRRSLVPRRTDQRTAFDHHFWKIEQQDIYASICLSLRRHMCDPQKRVDLQYISKHEDKFGQGVFDIIDAKGPEGILTFRHD